MPPLYNNLKLKTGLYQAAKAIYSEKTGLR